MGAPAPAEAEQTPEQSSELVSFKAACRHCGKQTSRRSRRGLTWRCRHCKTVNAGPALVAELAKEPEAGQRRRQRRRQATAEAKQGPAPVRRRSSRAAAPAPKEGMVAGESPAQGRTPPAETPSPAPAAPARPKRGLLDRIMYGSDDDGE